jgi:hypothetical protein
MRRSSLFFLGLFGCLFFNSCLQVNKPPSAVIDLNEGNTRIYGEPGDAPKQSKVTYEKLPDEIQKADNIRNILYPS